MSDDAQRIWREIGKPEAAQPTPEQLLAFMRLCDDADGIDLAERMIRAADEAHRCWLEGHDDLLSELSWMRRELAEARIKADAVDVFLKDDTVPSPAALAGRPDPQPDQGSTGATT